MANLTQGIRPQPYGQGGRKVFLPVKAGAQIYEGGLVSQPGGACAPTTAGGDSTGAIGIAEHDALGGATDGATRLSVWTDREFIFNPGLNPPTDATPYGTVLYAEDDHTVGIVNVGNALPMAGRFVGIEDDGRVRVFVGWVALLTGAL
ncbi:MAG: hypothetical protein FWD69_10475 [Polyangiaceae bacterium]|nr:hypothetical protein [Polyangiaceae bacterium]